MSARVHEALASSERFHADVPLPAPKMPPAELIEAQPAIDAELQKRAVWIPGYWEWDGDADAFVWTTGVWRFPPPQRGWMAGKWVLTRDGYVRVSGRWMPRSSVNVAFLTAPPPYKGRFPLPDALAENESWVPGCWIPGEGGQFSWREGFVSRRLDNWVWVSAQYSWTPQGWMFVDGYWDFPLEARGQAFASLRLTDPTYAAQPIRMEAFAPVPGRAIHQSSSGEFVYQVDAFADQFTLTSFNNEELADLATPVVVERDLPAPPLAIIRGVVRRGALAPAGIEVQLIGHPAVATTDEHGRFQFSDVPYGVYHVRAEGPVQNHIKRAYNRLTVAEPVIDAQLELR